MKEKTIFVTGCHRSGSTWVSKMIALSPGIAFIDEVFNPKMGLLKDKKLFKNWFPYITQRLEKEEYVREIQRIIDFKPLSNPLVYLRLAAILYSHSRPIFKNYASLITLLIRPFNYSRPLIKDPLALFSSEWLAERFNMDVVLLIRHPAAFVNSIIRIGWRFDFSDFLNQKELMDEHLFNYEDKMRKKDMDAVDEAALLWLCLYTVADKYIERNPEWIVKRHEDLSYDPIKEFKELYVRLGLEWTRRAEIEIVRFTSAKNKPDEYLNKVHYQIRNSRANIKAWKKRLTDEEVNRIKKVVESISCKYYNESDW